MHYTNPVSVNISKYRQIPQFYELVFRIKWLWLPLAELAEKKEVCTQLKEQKRVLTVCNSNKKEIIKNWSHGTVIAIDQRWRKRVMWRSIFRVWHISMQMFYLLPRLQRPLLLLMRRHIFFTNVKKSFKKWFVSFLFKKNAEENYIGLRVVALCFFIKFSRAIS